MLSLVGTAVEEYGLGSNAEMDSKGPLDAVSELDSLRWGLPGMEVSAVPSKVVAPLHYAERS